ncbi:MAG: 4a-hydroxytetrahydrobiopterin dehydratase [Chloroflexi bacterium]|nr:4a-hydroxytetrahydrobiopterin dehydratase [Chloroflexota bacterium]
MPELASEKCIPCRGGIPPLTRAEIAELLPQIPAWETVERNGIPLLQHTFKFKNFTDALAFTNKVAALAEEHDHHPRLVTEWGRVTVQWWTHIIQGLHRNDFIMAAKTDALVQK